MKATGSLEGYRVLLAEDDEGMRQVMRFNLKEEGCQVLEATCGNEAIRLLHDERQAGGPPFDLVIADLKMPGAGGMEVMRVAHGGRPPIPVIIVTAFGTVDQALEAIAEGAADYITKPFRRAEFKTRVAAILERISLREENAVLKAKRSDSSFVAEAAAMQPLIRVVRRISKANATVLITGESGTGKELVAKFVHGLSGREGPFVPINCAALPRELLENELFGHDRGAFTGAHQAYRGKFERANHGTLFLDEIGELPLDLQAKTLRILEEGVVERLGGSQRIETDVRVVAATNRDLRQLVRDGQFREDLFHRLSVIPLAIPPLRERTEDIPLLVQRFLADLGLSGLVTVAPALLSELERMAWPGNVRELKNVVSRMGLLRRTDVLDLADLGSCLASEGSPIERGDEAEPAPIAPSFVPGRIRLPDESFSLVNLEEEIIKKALEKHGGNRSAAARYLQIPRHVLIYRLAKIKRFTG